MASTDKDYFDLSGMQQLKDLSKAVSSLARSFKKNNQLLAEQAVALGGKADKEELEGLSTRVKKIEEEMGREQKRVDSDELEELSMRVGELEEEMERRQQGVLFEGVGRARVELDFSSAQ